MIRRHYQRPKYTPSLTEIKRMARIIREENLRAMIASEYKSHKEPGMPKVYRTIYGRGKLLD